MQTGKIYPFCEAATAKIGKTAKAVKTAISKHLSVTKRTLCRSKATNPGKTLNRTDAAAEISMKMIE